MYAYENSVWEIFKNPLDSMCVMNGQLPPLVPYVRLKIRLKENESCKEPTRRFVTDFFFNFIIKPYLEVIGISDEERAKIEEAWSQALRRVMERSKKEGESAKEIKEFLSIPKGFIYLGKERVDFWGPNFYFMDWYFSVTLYLPFDEEVLEKYFDLVAKIVRQTPLPIAVRSLPLVDTVRDLLATCGDADVSIKLCNEELALKWLSAKVYSILPPRKDP